MYDFRRGDQRGIGTEATMVERWDPTSRQFLAASGPQGNLK
jgi:hypothetical protein